MRLAPGTRIGPYEVVSIVGAGGMGEVYRARDPKLNRDVALKTLPALVATDPDRLARFKREAQVLASLNHSRIAAIYGFEEAAGVQALVLELVEGPTLADRIAQGSIPVEEALAIAAQIAEALEAAHARGIVHRDLKPANIKVRADGSIKVLDFGLAKAVGNDGVTAEASSTSTITSPALTRLGVILGTAAYMSPEQARGKAADARSDIWAFGCVLFELLAGRRPFEGSGVSDTLATILKGEPAWGSLPSDTPSGIVRTLRRCLEKDPRRRFHHVADARLDLEDAAAADVATSPAAARSSDRRDRLAWGVVAVLALLLFGLGGYVALKSRAAGEITRFEVTPPPDTVFGSPFARYAAGAVSPDGTRLVFVTTSRTGQVQLWIRSFDSFDAFPLTGIQGAQLPFWSPDSRWVAFFAGNKLIKVDAAGGSPQTICDLPGELLRGGAWGAAGDILFSSGNPPTLYRVSDQGGAPVPLPAPGDQTVSDITSPVFLPDGRTFLYWRQTSSEGAGVYVASIASANAPKRLVSTDAGALYDASGFLLFTRRGALVAQRFDADRIELSGEARTVVERVAMTAGRMAAFSVSTNGVLTYQAQTGEASQFTWFDRAGRLLEKIGAPGRYRAPQMSPDETRLVYEDLTDNNLWVLDMNRGLTSKFTIGPGEKLSPIWSPDGGTIYYGKRTEFSGPAAIFEKRASGNENEDLFFKGPTTNGPAQISRDGKWLLYFVSPEGQTLGDVYAIDVTGDRTPRPIVRSPFSDVEPHLSPDGKFVAYVSTETGRSEIYVQPFPTGERHRISDAGGRQPFWRQDGKELFFVSPENNSLYAVAAKPGPKFAFDPPKLLFELRANVMFVRNSYIPTRDGQRILVNMALDSTTPPIRVIRNWTAGLKD